MPETPAARLAALVELAAVDPHDGLQVVASSRIAAVPVDPGIDLMLLRPPGAAGEASAGPLPGRHARPGALAVLRALYPPGHTAISLSNRAEVPLADLEEGALTGDDWLVPAVPAPDGLASPHALPWIVARLRAPDGCPWDRRQDHRTLRRFVLEEAYETVDAIERGTPSDLADELGDVLLQVVLHAQLAAEVGHFDLTDVYRGIAAKIVRRHPHVFGNVEVAGVEDVMRNWETLKGLERARAGDPEDAAPSTAFDRLVRAQPALPASRELQERASALGWDWHSVEGVWEKVDEELAELRASAPEERLHEVGDVLFATVNLARWLEVDPEEALRAANRRWVQRLGHVERAAAARGLVLADMSDDAKDALWEEAKRLPPGSDPT